MLPRFQNRSLITERQARDRLNGIVPVDGNSGMSRGTELEANDPARCLKGNGQKVPFRY